jgi:protein-S-isoprenylcysteine O-methyltransferase Ste14
VRFHEHRMQEKKAKLVSPMSILVDAILVIAFFLYMFTVVSTHVQSHSHRMILFWGVLCSLCITVVFWLALQMFRVVVKAQREGPIRS